MKHGIAQIRSWWPGSALAVVVALAATGVSVLHGGPQLLYALFFGISFHHLSHEPSTKPGIEFCSRTVLRLGVGLLGARITADQIASLGWATAGCVIFAVASTILIGIALARRLGMSRSQGVLSGGAVAICGASAALAISAVLPKEKEGDRFTLVVVVSVTALSTLAMVLYPLIAKLLHLDPRLAGLFLGGTSHDVAQGVGAGYTLGTEAGDFATIVKLFRVALLAVVVVLVATAFRSSRNEDTGGPKPRKQPLVPWFLRLFLGMVLANSLGAFNAQAQQAFGSVARACLVTAIAALGMKTSFAQLARAGWRSFALIVTETVWIAVVILLAIWWLRAHPLAAG
jgi:uncharacterized integral membrane protein (TIGR00698 family)